MQGSRQEEGQGVLVRASPAAAFLHHPGSGRSPAPTQDASLIMGCPQHPAFPLLFLGRRMEPTLHPTFRAQQSLAACAAQLPAFPVMAMGK